MKNKSDLIKIDRDLNSPYQTRLREDLEHQRSENKRTAADLAAQTERNEEELTRKKAFK